MPGFVLTTHTSFLILQVLHGFQVLLSVIQNNTPAAMTQPSSFTWFYTRTPSMRLFLWHPRASFSQLCLKHRKCELSNLRISQDRVETAATTHSLFFLGFFSIAEGHLYHEIINLWLAHSHRMWGTRDRLRRHWRERSVWLDHRITVSHHCDLARRK